MLINIRRADQSTRYHMENVVDALGGDGDTYTLAKTDGGWVVEWNGAERGSLVKCSHCGTVQDLWAGQAETCSECLR